MRCQEPSPAATNDAIDWSDSLTPEEYRILRQCGTEAPFTGEFWDHHEDGVIRMRWVRRATLVRQLPRSSRAAADGPVSSTSLIRAQSRRKKTSNTGCDGLSWSAAIARVIWGMCSRMALLPMACAIASIVCRSTLHSAIASPNSLELFVGGLDETIFRVSKPLTSCSKECL